MIHRIFCKVVRKFGSRTKNMNRHRFVAFPTKDRGFPFLLGPVCTTTKREFGVCKVLKMLSPIFLFLQSCSHLRQTKFLYNQKRMEIDWFYLFLIWCPLDIHDWYIQGVPKVRSSNFMHYNFWSKLYFYMKFLKDVYFSTEYMHSEFQLLACAFWFFITFCSRYGMKWDRAYRPTDDPFWAFLSPGAQEPVHPQTVFVYFRQLKNIYWAFIQKR